MITRRVVLVTGALCLVAAGLRYSAGQRGLPSETAIINAGAALYVSETGGSRAECIGVPGEGVVWISVVCGDGSDRRAYLFDRRGKRLIETEEPQA